MNNDLSGVLKEADPNEVIKELQTVYREVREENKRLTADVMFLENGKAELKAERDAYRKALEKISGVMYPNQGAKKVADEAMNQYPSPSPKDKDNANG